MPDEVNPSDHALQLRLLEGLAELRGEIRGFNERTRNIEGDLTEVKGNHTALDSRTRALELRQESLVSLEDLAAADVAREKKVSDALEVADRKAAADRAAADRKANFRLGILMAAVAVINVGIALLR